MYWPRLQWLFTQKSVADVADSHGQVVGKVRSVLIDTLAHYLLGNLFITLNQDHFIDVFIPAKCGIFLCQKE